MNLGQEILNVQNPALGSVLIWRFVCAFHDKHEFKEGAPLPITFLVLPMIYHERTREYLDGTRRASGLRLFASKFGDSKNVEQDLLLAISVRAGKLRALTLEALRIGFSAKLFALTNTGLLVPMSKSFPSIGISDEAKVLMRGSEKLGSWMSELTLHEISNILKVRF